MMSSQSFFKSSLISQILILIDYNACYIYDIDHDPDDDDGDDDDPDRPAGFCVQHNETFQVEEGKPM